MTDSEGSGGSFAEWEASTREERRQGNAVGEVNGAGKE